MYCTKCGAKLPRDARFCMNCGKPVAAIASEKAAASTASLGKAVAPAVVPAKVAEPKGASSPSQNNPSPEQSETLRGAVNATKHRSRRRVPMVVLVALAMALAAGTATPLTAFTPTCGFLLSKMKTSKSSKRPGKSHIRSKLARWM